MTNICQQDYEPSAKISLTDKATVGSTAQVLSECPFVLNQTKENLDMLAYGLNTKRERAKAASVVDQIR